MGRRGQDAIAERAQTNNADARAFRQLLQQGHAKLRLDNRLIHQHDRDVVPDRIDALTVDALQPAAVFPGFNVAFASGTNQNFKQVRSDGHGILQFINVVTTPGTRPQSRESGPKT